MGQQAPIVLVLLLCTGDCIVPLYCQRNLFHRSLLTIPWLEMGGVCTITCAQSQCTANVEFHCKVQAYFLHT